jgi:low affinity Fe/Cu permease
MKPPQSRSLFMRFAKVTSHATGRPVAFLTALALIIVWAGTGPYFRYSTDWQLLINTGTTIITFLMVFLIQNTQNRDSEALHLKLDELIRAMEGAHNALLDLEELDESDLDKIRVNYLALAKSARDAVRKGEVDTGRVELKGAETSRGVRRKEQSPPE